MRKALFILVLLVAMSGCATTHEAAAPAMAPRDVAVLSGADGSRVAWAAVVQPACEADVVIIGETHSHPVGLATAAALWEDILKARPKAVLSLEFFERDQQSGLDDYLLHVTDEEAFKKATGRTAGSYPAGHKAMVESARGAARPVIASNAPRRYLRIARNDGFDALAKLTPEQHRLFRVPDALPEGRYRDDFRKFMTEDPTHLPKEPAEREKALEGSFRSQSMWDWTMAESIARGLDQGKPVVHVVGHFHSDFRGGLVQALERMRPGTRIVTLTFLDEDSASLRDDDRNRADFVIYVGPGKEAK